MDTFYYSVKVHKYINKSALNPLNSQIFLKDKYLSR